MVPGRSSDPADPGEPSAGHGGRFLLVTFVLAAAVGIAVGYLGIQGYLGGPIP